MAVENMDGEYLYTETTRKEILPLIHEKAATALEIGCSFGNTLTWLKQEGHCERAFGVEINERAAEEARKRLDGVFCGNVENIKIPLAPGSVNLLLCLDVLEHLHDPWGTLRKLQEQLLAPGGILIVSVPNVQHHSVVFPLLFKGKWPYAGSGLLDKSHLRFFTRNTTKKMITDAGFQIEAVTNTKFRSSMRLINFLTFNLFKPMMVFQYFIRARKIQ